MSSFDLSLAPPETTIHLLGSLLERMTNANDQLGQLRQDHSLSHSPSAHTRFHARSIPSIALSPYLFRILKYCPCTNECFLAVLVYFDRMAKHSLATNGQPFSIDSYNIHRLIITGVMIATKFFSDIFYTNARYAKVGGIALSELNRLEVEFLTLNSFNMSVSVSELQRYGDSLLNMGIEHEMRRGLYDYTYPLVRHNRSISLGNPMADRGQRIRTWSSHSVDRLTERTSRISLDVRSAEPLTTYGYYNGYYRTQEVYGYTPFPGHMFGQPSLVEVPEDDPDKYSIQTRHSSKRSNQPASKRLSLACINAPPFVPGRQCMPTPSCSLGC